MDRLSLITGKNFTVTVLMNGVDVTHKLPVARVIYRPDGTGARTLRDGSVVTGQWKFINDAQTQMEVQGPEGVSRWVITELSPSVYRKANIDTGVEFVHTPVPA